MSFDWEFLAVVILRLFVMSLIVQLALEAFFRWDGYTALEAWARARFRFGVKFPLALVLSYALCRQTSFDVIAELFTASNGWAGYIVTALAVCGGTAPFLAVFAKIEAAREAARTATATAQAARTPADVTYQNVTVTR